MYYLSLSRNTGLVSELPATFYNLVNLTNLYIYDTQISGSLNEQIGNFTKLKIFYGYRNKWSGSIPASLGNISTLEELYLFSNELTGSIPPTFRNLNKLKHIWLHFNQLTGETPAWFGELSDLITLSFGDNNLTGEVPEAYGNLNNLTELYLQKLNLEGPIPDQLQSLNKIVIADLKSSHLTGEIPAWLTNKPTMKRFILNDNSFIKLPDAKVKLFDEQIVVNKLNISDTKTPSFDGALSNIEIPSIDGVELPNEKLNIEDLSKKADISTPNVEKLNEISGEINKIDEKVIEAQKYEEEIRNIKESGSYF